MSSVVSHLADADFVPAASWTQFGWGESNDTEKERAFKDATLLEEAVSASPNLFAEKESKPWDEAIKGKFDAFQASKGYEEGSCDLSLLGEFIFGRRYAWLPQKTGSCVVSNTFRNLSRRMLAEILLRGQLEELLGRDEFGPNTIAPYAAISYGIMRQYGNLRGGDGGFCGPMIKSLQDGILDCNNGRLHEILTKLNATSDRDFPEPQDNGVYRKFQNWTYNEELKPFLTNPLTESVAVSSVEDLDAQAVQYKPVIMCSMLAVKRGPVNDGLTTFVIDRGNKWPHCMSWCGKIIWNGKTYHLLSNESWRADLIYPIEENEVDSIIKNYKPQMQSLGEVDMDASKVAV